MFATIEAYLIATSHSMSLELFAFIASFVEEVVAPIPSPTVMMLAGSLAKVQEYSMLGLFMLALFGALGKTLGALLIYVIADKAEDVIMHRFGKFFNITHEEVEEFGKKLSNGPKDYIVLTVLRAMPLIPSVLLSAGAGLLKIPLPIFIVTTFLGTVIKDGVYLYTGYMGLKIIEFFVRQATEYEIYVQVAIAIAVLGFIAYRVMKKRAKNKQS